MIRIDIPDFGALSLEHLVMDYNGTLAMDGVLIPGVAEVLEKLSSDLQIHVITADTFGKAHEQVKNLPVSLKILPLSGQAEGKKEFVRSLSSNRCISIGNGRNDRLMLKESVLGIAVIQNEGAAQVTILSADVVVNHILDALHLLLHPLRLVATLRG